MLYSYMGFKYALDVISSYSWYGRRKKIEYGWRGEHKVP